MADKKITLELMKLYRTYADRLTISANLSAILHRARDIKASGNEIEIAVRSMLNELLPLKYKISNGHIIDQDLNVSKQYDLIIAEHIDHNPIAHFNDTTELFFYESIYLTGEIKATWNLKNLHDSMASIKDLKSRLKRKGIDNKTLISGNQEVQLDVELTKNPIRNPLFNFVFAIKEDADFHKFKEIYKVDETLKFQPNITVILNRGIFILVSKCDLESGKLTVQLYPEYVTDFSSVVWKFIDYSDGGRNLAYLLFCISQHLNNVILEKPPYLKYSASLLELDIENLLDLDEL